MELPSGTGTVTLPGVEWCGGLRLAGTPLWLDAPSPKDLAFVSRPEVDLMVAHRRALTAPVCAASFPGHRHGTVLAVDYGRTVQLGTMEVTLHPSGFCPGAAQIEVRLPAAGTFLYTGLFSLDPVPLAEPLVAVPADVLLVEVPPKPDVGCGGALVRNLVGPALVEAVEEALRRGLLPVVLLERWRSGEVLLLLRQAGIPTRVHRGLARLLRATRLTSVTGRPLSYRGKASPGSALLWPSDQAASPAIRKLAHHRSGTVAAIRVRGGAGSPLPPSRQRAPAFPLLRDITVAEGAGPADIAAYVARCAPRRVYLTGPGAEAALPAVVRTGVPTFLVERPVQLGLRLTPESRPGGSAGPHGQGPHG